MEFTIKHARTGINIQDYKCYIWVSQSGEEFILWYHVLTILCYILVCGYNTSEEYTAPFSVLQGGSAFPTYCWYPFIKHITPQYG
jgi:hypothetical protein